MADLIALFGTSQVQTIVTLIVIDVVLGIIAALYRKAFDFGKLCNFMKGPVLAYVFGFVVIEMVGQSPAFFGFCCLSSLYFSSDCPFGFSFW